MSCPLGFTAEDEADGMLNPHASMQTPASATPATAERSLQPPQSDGRIPPPLPVRPSLQRVGQGPVPRWASVFSSWSGWAWRASRATILAFLVLALAPSLHILRILATLLATMPLLARPVYAAFRLSAAFAAGVICCLFESLSGTRLMFSGVVPPEFWTPIVGDADVRKGQSTTATVFVSNQVSHSFADAVVFACLAYRRGLRAGGLYFLPLDQRGWTWLEQILHLVCLSPLVVSSSAEADQLLAHGPCSFVWMPEATAPGDLVPLEAHATFSTQDDLLYVRRPKLSAVFAHLVARSVSPLRSESAINLAVVECTLAYTGSVQAELAQKHADAVALASDSAPASTSDDEREEGHFLDRDDQDEEGYSADTINACGPAATLLLGPTRPPRPLEAVLPVFLTAAPLRALSSAEEESFAVSSSPRVRQARLRRRTVPGFADFLCGNAPSYVHLLMNGYGSEYMRSIALKVPSPSAAAASSSSSSDGDSTALPSLDRLDSWLHQRFLHQEQQLSLFALHGRFHLLSASLSASSIPCPVGIESYASPVSSLKLAAYIAVEWTAIVIATVVFRNTRAWWNAPPSAT